MLTLAAADTLAGVAQTATTVTCTIFGMELVGTTETYKVLDQRQLAAAAATIYTAPASTQAFVKSIHVVNTNTGATQTFQLFRGGTAAANAITPAITLPAGGFAVYDERGWQIYTSAGALVQTPILMLLSRTRILQGTTTYTVPTGTRSILVQCIGAGGGGGGGSTSASNASLGAGGGGGAYSEKYIVTPKTTAYTVAVGQGGTAGANTGGTGGTGGDTTFDSPSVCTAKGGAGGQGQTFGTAVAFTTGGAGGAAASGVGDVLIDGEGGDHGVRQTGLIGASGDGGSAAGALGGGGGIGKVAAGVGSVGGLYGGGAGGAAVLNGSAAALGGVGGNGVIVVSEYG